MQMSDKRILVVDDEPDVTAYLKSYFQQHKLEVLTASTGEEGLSLLLAHKPAIVLLDLRLGDGISGIEVLRRSLAAKTGSQIIVVTAVDDRNVASMAMGLGAADYLTKPFMLEELERIVLNRLKDGA
jgi:DNA-binding response OmpR family regulator